MKFWTALQEPLFQAALIENGKIVKRIPEKPPNTPVRRVMAVGKYQDKLVIGKRNSLELWDFNGNECLQTIYSPYIYGLHEINQYKDNIIICCTSLDGVFELDIDGNCLWKWFAHEHGYCPDAGLLEKQDWETIQLTQNISPPNSSHLNSCRVNGDKALISLMNNKKIIELDIGKDTFREILAIKDHGVHGPIYINGDLCYATFDELILGNKKIKYDYATKKNYLWIKRIVENNNSIYFSHETGISFYREGKFTDMTFPRPFGIIF